MKKYLAYCRVSTKAQADKDNSLPTQKRIIMEYAQRKKYEIVEWYSEAKSGYRGKRTEFHSMITHLKNEPSIEGVIFHKLDRSSRNVGDFSLLDKLITQKKKKMCVIEGEFDTSRSAGRLAFRNFCNMCVWYSENLSEEVSTKMAEVLRKGYYPTNAPIGYRNGIKGQDEDPKKKHPDPVLAPFMKEAFEMYATGEHSLRTLCEYMRSRGMTNSTGGYLRPNIFERALRNPFYHGLIKWNKKSGTPVYYEGNHEPIISKKLFDKVQDVFEGNTQRGNSTHDYTYMKMVKCECGRYLICGKHKDHLYLECHNPKCEVSNIREDRLEDQIMIHLSQFALPEEFLSYAKMAVKELSKNVHEDNKARRKALNMKLAQLDGRLEKVNNAVIEGYFDTEEGIQQKNKIIEQKQILVQQLSEVEENKENDIWDMTTKLVEIFNYLPYRFRELNPIIKRKILRFLFLNLQLDGGRLLVQAVPEFESLKLANFRLQGEKLSLNSQPNGKKPRKKATSEKEMALSGAEKQYG